MQEMLTIGEHNFEQHLEPPPGYSKGCIPRNYETHPQGYLGELAPTFDLPLIDDPKEQQERLDEQTAKKAKLSDIRNLGWAGKPIPSRDQNGKGYCWAHSSTSAALIIRALMNEPYADLSAYAVACIIKHYRDEGGWGAESLKFIAERGIPTSQFWPQRSMSQSNDKPETWANAALHKFTKWFDGEPRNVHQLITCLLLNIPVVVDFNWWGHSVCALDLISINPLKILIWNSWGDTWSQNGTGILQGNHAIPDGMVMPEIMLAAAA